MKRLFKFLVAAATSLSLLFANIPLTQVIVRADTITPELTNSKDDDNISVTLNLNDASYPISESESVYLFSIGNVDANHIFEPTTINVTFTSGCGIDKLEVRNGSSVLAEASAEEVESSCDIDNQFRVLDVGIETVGEEASAITIGFIEILREVPNDPPPMQPGDYVDYNVTGDADYTIKTSGTGNNELIKFGWDTYEYSSDNYNPGHAFDAGIMSVSFDAATSNADNLLVRIDGVQVYESSTNTNTFMIKSNFKVHSFELRDGHWEVNLQTTEETFDGRMTTIKVISTVSRNITFTDSEGRGLFNAEAILCEGMIRSTFSDEPDVKELVLEERPVGFDLTISPGPGGQPVGAEEYVRLAGVTIDGDEKSVKNRYDPCHYDIPDSTSDSITIVLTGDDTQGYVIGWMNSDCDTDNPEKFNHGSAKVIGVYEGPDVEHLNNVTSNYDLTNGCVLDDGTGELRLESGYWVEFSFTPEPGYQLWTFYGNANDQAMVITTGDTANSYFFQMPDGNVHFQAKFETPENIVKIQEGSIVNGGSITVPQNEFAGGTAQMTVGALDNNTRSAYDKNQEVQAELDDKNMEIQEYLSLDLANVYHKANSENDYWANDYHELTEGNAEVSLVVDGKFNPNNNKVYIVHDLGDGEGVETIEADYNPNTHEITFETGSFSNFMIATSDEKNDVDVVPNNNNNDPVNDDPENIDEPEDYIPHFSVTLDEYDEPALGNWEGEDHPFFAPVEIGQAIPGDSVIHNDLPNDLSDDIALIYYINGEEVESFYMNERDKTFSPGHFVVLDGVYASEDAFMVFFTECYVVGIDVIQMDLSMKAQDKDGKVIEPVGGSDKDGALIFECGDAGEEDFTYFEIAYPVCPAEVVVKGINDYAIFYLECNEKDMFNTPIGENSIEYPSEDDYIWIGAWGMVPDSETVNFTDSLTKVSAVFEGVSEDKIDDYLLLVTEFDTSDASEEEIAAFKKQIAEKGYDIFKFPLGFDITLYDKNGEVHEPGFTVRITLVLEKALDLEDGETVLILHMLDDDKFEIIEAVYNAKNLTLTFETKSFSPFVVAFGTKAAPAAVVKTGETVNTTRIVIASILIGAAAAAGILFIRRRETEIEKKEN